MQLDLQNGSNHIIRRNVLNEQSCLTHEKKNVNYGFSGGILVEQGTYSITIPQQTQQQVVYTQPQQVSLSLAEALKTRAQICGL